MQFACLEQSFSRFCRGARRIGIVMLVLPLGSLAASAGTAWSAGASASNTGSRPTQKASYRSDATQCLAEAIYFESRGRSETAAHAVAYVVLNRREHDAFPATVCGVVTEECQFSYRCDGRPETLSNPAERDRAYRAARAVLQGLVDDPTHGALFFHADHIEPAWFNTLDRTVEIGGNVFYR